MGDQQQQKQQLEEMVQAGSPSSRRREFLANLDARSSLRIVEGIMSQDEASRILEAARRAVKRKGGWSTERHRDFATTDLPLFELSTRAFAFVRRILRERLLAWCAKQYNLDVADLFFKDLFIVSYNADEPNGQRELAMHHDGSLFSFNVNLSPEGAFEGGGTHFPQLGAVKINQGDAVVHDGKVLHAGAPVTKGERVILVAFVDTVLDETPSFGDSELAHERRDAQELRALHERERKSAAKVDDAVEDAMFLLHAISVDSDDEDAENKKNDLYAADEQGSFEDTCNLPKDLHATHLLREVYASIDS
mmetsp:Transcript_16324/g.31682  ORF Transcript_16324/g.31682 Transcript_16324/m.31682 type:complete len:307 (+) Transcript_16324:189-1109(+)